MSTNAPPTPPPAAAPEHPMTSKEAKAQAKASKAYAKASRPFWRKPWFIILAVIVVIVIAASAGGGGGGSGGGSTDSSNDTTKAAGLGDPALSGDFQFTATKIECGQTKIGPALLSEKAQGQFCLLSLSVKNTGNDQQLLLDSEQKILDADGNKYGTSSAAALYEASSMFFEQINPGNEISGVLVFDIPEAVTPTKAEFVGPGLLDDSVEVTLK